MRIREFLWLGLFVGGAFPRAGNALRQAEIAPQTEETARPQEDLHEEIQALELQFQELLTEPPPPEFTTKLMLLAHRAHALGDVDALEGLLHLASQAPREYRAVIEIDHQSLILPTKPVRGWIETHLRAANWAVELADYKVARCLLDAAPPPEGTAVKFRLLHAMLSIEIELHEAQFVKARTQYEDFRALAETENLGSELAIVLAHLGHFEFRLAMFNRCRQTWERVLSLTAGGKYPGAECLALIDRCNLFRLEGNFGDMILDASRVLKLFETSRGNLRQRDELAAYYQRGFAHQRRGELDLAQTDFKHVIDQGTTFPQLVAAAMDGLARVALDRGQLEEGRRHVDEALDLERKHRQFDYLLDTLQTSAEIALQAGDAARAEKDLNEASSIIESPQVSGLGARHAAELRSRFAKLGELAQDLTLLRWHQAETPEQRAATAEAGLQAAMRWGGRALAAGLGERGGIGDLAREANPIELVRRNLGSAGGLVQYADGTQQSMAYVLTVDSIRFEPLGSRSVLEKSVAEFGKGALSSIDSPPAEVYRLSRDLHDRAFAPIVSSLAEANDRVYVVPSSTLIAVPLEALAAPIRSRAPIAFHEVPFLLTRWKFAYLPSALLLPILNARGAAPPSERAMLLGDAIFPGEIEDKSQFRLSDEPLLTLERLPGTRGEVLEAGRCLVSAAENGVEIDAALKGLLDSPRRSAQILDNWGIEVYLGANANMDLFRESRQSYELIHFATHTYESLLNPYSAALVLSPDTRGEILFDVATIRTLKLAVNLVVLSTCLSAQGPLLRGDGSQSLAAAFFEAGARCVVASVAKIDDNNTYEVMKAFYEQMVLGEPPFAALHKIKVEQKYSKSAGPKKMRSDQRFGIGAVSTDGTMETHSPGHPYHWATIIYQGIFQ